MIDACESGKCEHTKGKRARVVYAMQCRDKICPEYMMTYTLDKVGPCPACGAIVKVMWSWVEG